MKIGPIILVVVVGVVGLSLLFAFPLKWLWNWLMPMIFGLMELNFWQSFGMLMISGMLFKSSSFNPPSDY